MPLSTLNNSQNQDGQGHATEENNKTKSKKKQVRLLLDARTELTNEELEVRGVVHPQASWFYELEQRARANYLEQQAEIRKNAAQKKAEKDCGRMFEEMIWGAPRGCERRISHGGNIIDDG